MSDIEALHKALSCGGDDEFTHGMKDMLSKLGLMPSFGGVLEIEDLEAILKTVTFNHGVPSQILMSPQVFKDLKKLTDLKP